MAASATLREAALAHADAAEDDAPCLYAKVSSTAGMVLALEDKVKHVVNAVRSSNPQSRNPIYRIYEAIKERKGKNKSAAGLPKVDPMQSALPKPMGAVLALKYLMMSLEPEEYYKLDAPAKDKPLRAAELEEYHRLRKEGEQLSDENQKRLYIDALEEALQSMRKLSDREGKRRMNYWEHVAFSAFCRLVREITVPQLRASYELAVLYKYGHFSDAAASAKFPAVLGEVLGLGGVFAGGDGRDSERARVAEYLRGKGRHGHNVLAPSFSGSPRCTDDRHPDQGLTLDCNAIFDVHLTIPKLAIGDPRLPDHDALADAVVAGTKGVVPKDLARLVVGYVGVAEHVQIQDTLTIFNAMRNAIHLGFTPLSQEYKSSFEPPGDAQCWAVAKQLLAAEGISPAGLPSADEASELYHHYTFPKTSPFKTRETYLRNYCPS